MTGIAGIDISFLFQPLDSTISTTFLAISSINKIRLISSYASGRHFFICSPCALIITCHINEIHDCMVIYI